MSLQALWALVHVHPARVLNDLALFFCCAGAWLLLATRRRERLAARRGLDGGEAGMPAVVDLRIAYLRVNRFFYRFGFACLGLALLVSWYSTRL
ncbi:MAG: hypothetical protein GAK34_00029 [Delftia tsuruhatensis]|nr:MAG: hypothetical protein GAK34_00029 [Delftia tsuruhatensis]